MISEYALNGLYVFRSVDLFRDAYITLGKKILASKGEIFVAPLYEYLLKKGQKVVLSQSEETYPLGTPEELKAFEEKVDDYQRKFSLTGCLP